mmetsp:Transcript_19757/g.27954  ORF Transcript_19757/g.27954 Transcript_19757/m.27954 type:complete len:208 (-) Transcript_19757:251-874(-)
MSTSIMKSRQFPQNCYAFSMMVFLLSTIFIQLPLQSNAFTSATVVKRVATAQNPSCNKEVFSVATSNSSLSKSTKANFKYGVTKHSELCFSLHKNLNHRNLKNRPALVGPQEGREMRLYERKAPSDSVTGTGTRGQILFSLALVFCIWLFTIPTEFRRAYICSGPACVENRASCNNCKTLGELRQGVAEYYKNGGGIQFDFSVESKD